jgi:hypothetical protein
MLATCSLPPCPCARPNVSTKGQSLPVEEAGIDAIAGLQVLINDVC